MAILTNDELIKLRSRMYRGYRAPMAVTEFFARERIESMVRDANGNVQTLVQSITSDDGTRVTKTTDFTLDPVTGAITDSTVTYSYEDTTP